MPSSPTQAGPQCIMNAYMLAASVVIIVASIINIKHSCLRYIHTFEFVLDQAPQIKLWSQQRRRWELEAAVVSNIQMSFSFGSLI